MFAKPFYTFCRGAAPVGAIRLVGFGVASSDLFLVELITLDKAVYPSFGVNNFLLSGVEGMATAANFNTDLRFGGAELNLGAANTGRGDLLVLGMNSVFHY
jgi:hypothetical protein